MIDLHCHILPCVDDGATSWEMADQMCQMAFDDGITHIVATPHANSKYPYRREIFSELLAKLQRRTKTKLRFSLGCDFHLSYENIESLFSDAGQFLIEGTPYLLIEFNDYALPPNFERLLFRMNTELDIRPILTHPERNPILQRHPESILPWVNAGCLIQVTAGALIGKWGQRACEVAMWLLQNNAIHVVATDAHDPFKRPPILSAAREFLVKTCGGATALNLLDTNPLAIVHGQAVGSSS